METRGSAWFEFDENVEVQPDEACFDGDVDEFMYMSTYEYDELDVGSHDMGN